MTSEIKAWAVRYEFEHKGEWQKETDLFDDYEEAICAVMGMRKLPGQFRNVSAPIELVPRQERVITVEMLRNRIEKLKNRKVGGSEFEPIVIGAIEELHKCLDVLEGRREEI